MEHLKLFKNKVFILIYFVLINLPLLFFTANTTNWSDDYQYVNLASVKAKFTPLLPLLLEPVGGSIEGGHFAPVHRLVNYLFTIFTIDPRFYHFLVVLFYIGTAILVYVIIQEIYHDKVFALFAGTLFSLNYYLSVKSLTWNCFNYSATNSFTGALSLYFLFRYFNTNKQIYLFYCGLCFLLTIFNLESGFVFFHALIIIIFFWWLKKKISLKKLFVVFLIILVIVSLYPIGAYLKAGKAVPLSYRFKLARSIQGYAFHANDLFIKSMGLSILYNKLIFNKLKENSRLKETVIQFVRENKQLSLKGLPGRFLVVFTVLAIFSILFFIFVMIVMLKRLRSQTRMFFVIYGCLFLIFLLVFYRTDIANALSIFSSIIIADLIISFLRDKKKFYQLIGYGILGLYLILTPWVIFDRFDDCYRKSFFGLSKIAMQGPDKIYREINRKIGRYAKEGIILFTHDYSLYHHTGDTERIGDMVGIGDFACFHATVYSQELLKTNIIKRFKYRSMFEFEKFISESNNKQIVVSSKDEALRYLQQNDIDTSKVTAIYISKDYRVFKL